MEIVSAMDITWKALLGTHSTVSSGLRSWASHLSLQGAPLLLPFLPHWGVLQPGQQPP